jgi:hypothetical protein
MRIWTCTPKGKKLLRVADAQFLAGQTPDLPKLQLRLRELKIDDIQLEEGRTPHRSLYRLARSGRGFVTALVLPRGNAADSPHFAAMVKGHITNTGVIPSMASADDGYSTQQG